MNKNWRIFCIVYAVFNIISIILFIGLILFQTVLKPKAPILQTVSSTVDGMSFNISSIPPYDVQLNFTLTVQTQLTNPNLVDFEYKTVENKVYYRDVLVGNLTLPSSTLPAKGSVILPCPLVLQIDKLVADISDLVQDVLINKAIVVVTKASMPGKIRVGLFWIHLKTVTQCTLELAFPSMKVAKQVCKLDAKL